MAFNDRLKEARLASGLTQEQLADKIGVDKSTVTGYEKGNSEPNMLTVQRIMQALNVDANFLWQDEMANTTQFIVSTEEKEHIKKYRTLDKYGKKQVNCVLDNEYERCVKEPEPLYTTVTKPNYLTGLSAGTGLFVFDDVPCEQIEVPIEFKDIDFVIGVTGDSMEPEFYDGDQVMIKKGEVRVGEIGAFMYDGEAYIKVLGDKKLISLNKNYPDKEISEDTQFEVIGKVVGKVN